MASRRRTSPKPEPLDLDRELDEMYASPITRPNLGFLRVGGPPALSLINPAARTSEAESVESPDPIVADAASSVAVSKDTYPVRHIKVIASSSVPASSVAPSMDVVSMDVRSVRPSGKWKIHQCATVQDGHSANEQLLYEMLWRTGRVITLDQRLVTISREDMAAQARITVRNVKGILDRLIEKLAVERVIEPNSFARTAATYRIYSYRRFLSAGNRQDSNG